jgi:hypothetical protein
MCVLLGWPKSSATLTKKLKEKFDKLEEADVLSHAAYSPDAAPSDYGLFRSMEHFLRGRQFESFD